MKKTWPIILTITFERLSSHPGKDRLNFPGLVLMIGYIVIFSFILPLVSEARNRTLSVICDLIFSKNIRVVFFLLIFTFIILRFYLSPGNLYTDGDVYSHLSRSFIFSDSIHEMGVNHNSATIYF